MKNFIVIFFLIFSFSFSLGQGNLQFNQAIYIPLSQSVPSIGGTVNVSQTFTVPVGKTLKLESAGCSFQINLLNNNGFNARLALDNRLIASNKSASHSDAGDTPNFPIWLPSGTYSLLLEATAPNTGSILNCYGFLSGIEFNIVP